MKKTLITIFTLYAFSLCVMASDQTAVMSFFKNYINEANTYSASVTDMYSPTAKIIRQVVKPDGTTVNVYTDTATYIKQMKIAQAGARLRGYTNSYSDIKISKVSDNKYKISSLRQPVGENYKLKTYMIVQKQPNGKWLIVEEMMQTKQQIFLRYAK